MRLPLLLLFLLLHQAAAAQDSLRLLKGMLQMEGDLQDYQLEFTTTDSGYFKGISTTESREGKLKAYVTGREFPDGTIVFTETGSLSGQLYYCFFSGRLVRLKDGRQVWYKGKFSSRTGDGTPCPGGYMELHEKKPRKRRKAPRS